MESQATSRFEGPSNGNAKYMALSNRRPFIVLLAIAICIVTLFFIVFMLLSILNRRMYVRPHQSIVLIRTGS